MAGITSTGLTIKSLSDIITNMNSKLVARYGSNYSTDTNNPFYNAVLVFAEEAADIWEAVQGTYDASFPKSASAINLDNVCDIVDVQRIAKSKSSALVEFTGAVGAVVPAETVVKVTDSENRFLLKNTLTLTNTQFSDITVSLSSVANSTIYQLTINNTVVSITSGSSATTTSILAQLKAGIDTLVSGVTTSYPTASTLRINVTEVNSVLPIVVGVRIAVDSVSDLVEVVAQDYGVVKAPATTLSNLLVPIIGINSLTNYVDATEGREEETDEELRVRRYESVGIVGAGTDSAITANVRNLTDVSAAFTISNRTYSVDSDGRPPKSFEVVVEGGDDLDIANTVFKYQPAGIESTGTITKTIVDDDGNPQVIKFSRPTNIYIKMEIDYTKYDEELFALTGEEGIKAAALEYGNLINIGVDVMPQRFFGNIFSKVQGISSLAIRVASSTDLSTWTPLSTSPVVIGRKQNSVFDITRIIVNEV